MPRWGALNPGGSEEVEARASAFRASRESIREREDRIRDKGFILFSSVVWIYSIPFIFPLRTVHTDSLDRSLARLASRSRRLLWYESDRGIVGKAVVEKHGKANACGKREGYETRLRPSSWDL